MDSERFGAALSLVAAPPNEASFEQICDLLDPDDLDPAWLELLLVQLQWWPDDIARQVPRSWLRTLLAGLPCPTARMCNSLELCWRGLLDDHVSALAQADELANLRTLNLRNNAIGDVGATAIARSNVFARLEVLDLSGNRIGDWGAAALATSPHLRQIEILDLSGNCIGQRGLHALSAARRQGVKLTYQRAS